MIEACRLPLDFDAPRLREELERAVAAAPQSPWIEHFNGNDYRGNWTVAPLRSLGGAADNIYPAVQPPEQFASTELLKRCPYMEQTLDTLACQKTSVRLMRLGPGSEIKEHADSSAGYEDGAVRLHLPVQTHPDVEFYLNDQCIRMQEGECWYLNFNLPHRVRNASPRDRIHLVVDCPVDAWLEGMFQSLGFGEEERRGPPSVQPELSRQEALQMIEHLRLIDTDTARELMREIAGKHDLDRS